MKLLKLPIFWGATYLSSIFFFALMYSTIDRGFVQSTAHLESATDEIRLNAITNFSTSFVRECDTVHFVHNDSGWVKFSCRNKYSLIDLAIRHVEREGELIISYEEYGHWVAVRTQKHDHNPFLGELAAKYKASFLPLCLFSYSTPPPLVPHSDPSTIPNERLRSVDCDSEISMDWKVNQFVVDDEATWVELEKFFDERSGLIRSGFENFPRMLYFSAVTATTLGYGDIVPVKDNARNLVTTQAIVGLVLLGVFLNSLVATRIA